MPPLLCIEYVRTPSEDYIIIVSSRRQSSRSRATGRDGRRRSRARDRRRTRSSRVRYRKRKVLPHTRGSAETAIRINLMNDSTSPAPFTTPRPKPSSPKILTPSILYIYHRHRFSTLAPYIYICTLTFCDEKFNEMCPRGPAVLSYLIFDVCRHCIVVPLTGYSPITLLLYAPFTLFSSIRAYLCTALGQPSIRRTSFLSRLYRCRARCVCNVILYYVSVRRYKRVLAGIVFKTYSRLDTP